MSWAYRAIDNDVRPVPIAPGYSAVYENDDKSQHSKPVVAMVRLRDYGEGEEGGEPDSWCAAVFDHETGELCPCNDVSNFVGLSMADGRRVGRRIADLEEGNDWIAAIHADMVQRFRALEHALEAWSKSKADASSPETAPAKRQNIDTRGKSRINE